MPVENYRSGVAAAIDSMVPVIPGRAKREPGISRFPGLVLRTIPGWRWSEISDWRKLCLMVRRRSCAVSNH